MNGRVGMTRAISGLMIVVLSLVLLGMSGVVAVAKKRGPVTNLPMPRYVSMRAAEGNVRRGPSLTHRVDWIFKHENMPLKIVAEYGHWRRVQDAEGQGGWMHFRLLSGIRTVVFTAAETLLRRRGYTDSQLVAKVEKGAVGFLKECTADWCKITLDGARGWAPKTTFWGVDEGELRN